MSLTEAEMIIVAGIRDMRVTDIERVILLQIWKGLRFSSCITITAGDGHTASTPAEISAAKSQAESVFALMGIYFEGFELNGKYSGDYGYTVAVNKESADTLNREDFASETEAVISEGLMFGYPKTSVEAFAQGLEHTISRDELPEKIQLMDCMAVLWFKLSREHWQKELGYVKRIAECVRHFDPELYSAVLEMHRKSTNRKKVPANAM